MSTPDPAACPSNIHPEDAKRLQPRDRVLITLTDLSVFAQANTHN